MHKHEPVTLALALLAVIPSTSWADIDMRYSTSGASRLMIINDYGWRRQRYVGQLVHNVSSSSESAIGVGSQHFFLTEFDYPGYTERTYSVQEVDAYGFGSTPLLDVLAAADPQVFSPGVDDNIAAGFQLAVWEVMTDFSPSTGTSSLDLNAGDFSVDVSGSYAVDPDVYAEAQRLLNAVDSGIEFEGTAYSLQSPGVTDRLFATMPASPGGVPNTGAHVTATIALGLSLVRRRRDK